MNESNCRQCQKSETEDSGRNRYKTNHRQDQGDPVQYDRSLSVGGYMVKKMIEQQEKQMAGK